MKNYYIFICLDGIPTLELLLDHRKKYVKDIRQVDWHFTKYIVLDFCSKTKKEVHVIEQGNPQYKSKILTTKIVYYQINIYRALQISKKKEFQKLSRWKKDLICLSNILFNSEPIKFIDYMKKKRLLSTQDIVKLEEALKLLEEENKIIESWKNIQKPSLKKS